MNGQPADYKLEPGFGQSLVNVNISKSDHAVIEITSQEPLPFYEAIRTNGNSGDEIRLAATDAKILKYNDPQGVLTAATIQDGVLTGTLTTNAGDHLVFALAQIGEAQQWRQFKIKVTDTQAEAARAAKWVQEIPKDARLGLSSICKLFLTETFAVFSASILSPRPNAMFVADRRGWIFDLAR